MKNDKFAVIRVAGKQYKVFEGKDVLVDKIDEKSPIEVLLIADGDKVEIGTPVLENAKIGYEIKEPIVKGDKLRVFKYKSKSRYRKTIGHRSKYTKLHIKKIGN